MGRFRNRIAACLVDERRCIWKLLEPLVFESKTPGVGVVTVPAGFRTDFASVPRIPVAYFLAGATAHSAAVIHDYLYGNREFPRDVCDAVFLEAMKASKVPWWRRRIMWAAVRLFGGRAYPP